MCCAAVLRKGNRRNERIEWADEGEGCRDQMSNSEGRRCPGCDAMETTKRKRAHAHKAAARRQ